MKYTYIGNTTIKASQIGLGTWQFGTKGWGYGKDFTRQDSIKIVQAALDSGINLIDTAEVYGGGKSEEIIGEAIRDYDREELVITTKFFPKALRPSASIKALKKSLKRLKTDYIDIYLIHWPNPILPLGRTLNMLEKMVDEGVIRAIGLSNYSKNAFSKAQRKLKKHKLQVNQINYSMVKNKAKKNFLPFAKDEKITIMAYSPLAQGFLTGKYSEENTPKGIRRMNRLFRKKNLRRAKPFFATLTEIATKHNCATSQIALSYLIQDPEVIAIPGAKSIDQVLNNVKACDVSLGQNELTTLETALSDFRPRLFI